MSINNKEIEVVEEETFSGETQTTLRTCDVSKPTVQDDIKYPEWVHTLLAYFKFKKKVLRKVSEKGRKGHDRERLEFTLECNLCPTLCSKGSKGKSKTKNGEVTISGYSSTNFVRHLERRHNGKYNKDLFVHSKSALKRKRELSDDDGENDSQSSIVSAIIGSPNIKPGSEREVIKYDRNSPRQKEFEQICLEFVATDGVPFQLLDRKGFRKVILFADVRLTIPSKNTIRRHLMDKYAMLISHVKKTLEGVDPGEAHLVLDIWSSRKKQAVIGIQIRFVKNWRVQQLTLGFKHFPGSHTAYNIKCLVQDFLQKTYGLNLNFFHRIIADNASAILSAFSQSDPEASCYERIIEDTSAPSTLTAPNPTLLADPDVDRTLPEMSFDEEDLLDTPVSEMDLQDIRNEIASVEPDHDAIIDSVIREWNKATKTATAKRKSCLAHLLQLAINDALKHQQVASLLKKVNAIVAWFFKSDKWYEVLRNRCSNMGLVKPCDTRWNFQFYCIERLLKEVKEGTADQQKDLIVNKVNTVLNEARKECRSRGNKKLPPVEISSNEISALLVLQSILKPFAELTDVWQGDGVTSSFVLVGLLHALRELESVVDEENLLQLFKTEMEASMKTRFGISANKNVGRERRIVKIDLFKDDDFLLATVLDPSFKLIPFDDEQLLDNGSENSESETQSNVPTKEDIIGLLKSAYSVEEKRKNDELQIIDSQAQVPGTSTLSSICSEASETSTKSTGNATHSVSLKKGIYASLQQKMASKSGKEKVASEVDDYLSMTVLPPQNNPLRFWQVNKEKFPILSRLAVRNLSIPASSASVERLFSVAGSLISSRRACLHLTTAECLIMYKEYLHNTNIIS